MSAGPGSWSFRNPFVTMFDRQYGNKSDRAAGGVARSAPGQDTGDW